MPETNKNENDLLSIGKSYFEKEKYKEAIKILSELVVKLTQIMKGLELFVASYCEEGEL